MCSKDSDTAVLESVTPRWSKCSACTRTVIQHQHPRNRQPHKRKHQTKQNKNKQSNQRNKEVVEIKLKFKKNGIYRRYLACNKI
jgi:hypothetical protein